MSIFPCFEKIVEETSYRSIKRSKKNDLFSDPPGMIIGAPKGSSLSGKLFAVYNNILKYLEKSKCVKYADDFVIYFSCETIEECLARRHRQPPKLGGRKWNDH